jgi:broad specificity phosphatase PhoE
MSVTRRSLIPGSSDRCRVFLVRHGRTVLNAEHRFRGREDPELDAVGRAEAAQAAERLEPVALQEVYSSPLRRARATAGAIAARHPPLVAEIVRDLADLDYGPWTGRTAEEVQRTDPEAYRQFRTEPERAVIPGGESVAALGARVDRFLRGLARGRPGAIVAVVTHDLPIRWVLAHSAGPGPIAFWSADVPTGAVIPLRVGPAGVERTADGDATS